MNGMLSVLLEPELVLLGRFASGAAVVGTADGDELRFKQDG
jgi:hypothetical protein